MYAKRAMDERNKLNDEIVNVVSIQKFKKLYDSRKSLRDGAPFVYNFLHVQCK